MAPERAQRGRGRLTGRGTAAEGGERLTKKIASLGFGRRAVPAQKTRVVRELRQKHKLEILLSITQLPRAILLPFEADEWAGQT